MVSCMAARIFFTISCARRFGFRREIFLHVFLAQRLAQKLIGAFSATLPARLQLSCAVEIFAVKGEVFIHKDRKAGRRRNEGTAI